MMAYLRTTAENYERRNTVRMNRIIRDWLQGHRDAMTTVLGQFKEFAREPGLVYDISGQIDYIERVIDGIDWLISSLHLPEDRNVKTS